MLPHTISFEVQGAFEMDLRLGGASTMLDTQKRVDMVERVTNLKDLHDAGGN